MDMAVVHYYLLENRLHAGVLGGGYPPVASQRLCLTVSAVLCLNILASCKFRARDVTFCLRSFLAGATPLYWRLFVLVGRTSVRFLSLNL